MTLRALPLAACLSRAVRFILASLLIGASALASANAHAATLGVGKTGSGTVTSSPAGIDCGTSCRAHYTRGTTVTLIASAAPGYSFAGWSGACSGATATCALSITRRHRVAVTASFSQNSASSYTLTVSNAGSGTVTSSPGGINCATSCSASYAGGTNVTLTASAAPGYSFAGWSGACSGTGASCTVSMTAARGVFATFSQDVALTAPPDTTIQCMGSGLAATDLSGHCRSVAASTPGALEAIDPGTLQVGITWSPYAGTASAT